MATKVKKKLKYFNKPLDNRVEPPKYDNMTIQAYNYPKQDRAITSKDNNVNTTTVELPENWISMELDELAKAINNLIKNK